MKDFFISYSKEDLRWAEWISWHLEEAGYTTIFQFWDFRPGSNFILEMDRAFRQAKRTIAVLSQDYIDSLYTQPEWARAVIVDPKGEKGKMLPILVRDCEVRGWLELVIHIKLIGLDEAAAKKVLLNGVDRKRAKPLNKPEFPGYNKRLVDDRPTYPGMLPQIWNISNRRNLNFTGRKSLINQLRNNLLSGQTAAITQAISGLGGVGKTQLALEYAYRFAGYYDLVWWIRAEESATLYFDFLSLCNALTLPVRDTSDKQLIVDILFSWFNRNSRWLLIYDNALKSLDLNGKLPHASTGHIIITSRNPNWKGLASKLKVHELERRESIDFLCKRTDQDDRASANELADALGDLPLALEQAGAYIEETTITLSKYIDIFRLHRNKLWKKEHNPDNYPNTVATTWTLAMENVLCESKAAADLLNLFSYFGSDDIPFKSVIEGVKHLPNTLSQNVSDIVAMNQVISILRKYSLIESKGDSISIHRLVQTITRDRLSENEKKKWCATVLRIINNAFPFNIDDIECWDKCARLLPHSIVVTNHAEKMKLYNDFTVRLMNDTASYLKEQAELSEAMNLLQRALKISEACSGNDNPQISFIVNNLGEILHDLKDLEGARVNYLRALDIDETLYGLNHPQSARSLSNLGLILHELGDVDEAEKNLRRALKITKQTLKPHHPQVGVILTNLGRISKDSGNLIKSREFYEQALKIVSNCYGLKHPKTATQFNNIGCVLFMQKKMKEAKEYFQKALEIDEVTYGSKHPKVAIRLNNIGLVLKELGELNNALKLFKRALKIDELIYGPTHPKLSIRLNNIGSILQIKGNLNGAKSLYNKALNIDQNAYGKKHHKNALRANNIGSIYQSLGDYERAEKYYKKSLESISQYFGEKHQYYKIVINNLNSLKD